MAFKIEKVHVFVAIGEDGEEGVVAVGRPNGMLMPLVAADEKRLTQLRPLAQEVANKSNQTVRLLRFDVRSELETLTPVRGGN